ncbi:MAG TPA: sigma-70 family RNA polymerase sigma factor [Polyangiaceae bacterium]|nr:sigma-70 family RNA polymerase sigma factor [Polyangiaceae bacterium]
MIRDDVLPHQETMDTPDLVLPGVEVDGAPSPRTRDARITAIVRAEHDFIWRLLRRIGVPESSVDDATQQVFCVAARRVNDIVPGKERSYLFGIALRVASDRRRSREAREQPVHRDTEEVDPAPGPDELAEQRQRRLLLDEILAAMPMELRTVLVLFELEQMTKVEVAELLGLPVGTAVSRLRRAREEFKAMAKRRLSGGRIAKATP